MKIKQRKSSFPAGQGNEWLSTALLYGSAMDIQRHYKLALTVLFFLAAYYQHRNDRNPRIRKRIQRGALFFCLPIAALYFIQIISLPHLSILKTGLLYTNIYILAIICIVDMRSYEDIEYYVSIFSNFAILISIISIYNTIRTGISVGRMAAGFNFSKNYISAIVYLTFPLLLFYLREYREKKRAKLSYKVLVALILGSIVCLLSSSRTVLGVVVIIFIAILFQKERNIRRAIEKILGILAVAGILLLVYYNAPNIRRGIDRALVITSLEGRSSRNRLIEFGLAEFYASNHFIGTGSNLMPYPGYSAPIPVHNMFVEILLATGIIGFVIFLLLNTRFYMILISRCNTRGLFYLLMLLGAMLITAFFQPFFTTIYYPSLVVQISAMLITLDSERTGRISV